MKQYDRDLIEAIRACLGLGQLYPTRTTTLERFYVGEWPTGDFNMDGGRRAPVGGTGRGGAER